MHLSAFRLREAKISVGNLGLKIQNGLKIQPGSHTINHLSSTCQGADIWNHQSTFSFRQSFTKWKKRLWCSCSCCGTKEENPERLEKIFEKWEISPKSEWKQWIQRTCWQKHQPIGVHHWQRNQQRRLVNMHPPMMFPQNHHPFWGLDPRNQHHPVWQNFTKQPPLRCQETLWDWPTCNFQVSLVIKHWLKGSAIFL